MPIRYATLLLLTLVAPLAHGQAVPAGSVPGDIQVGVGYANANPDYSPHRFNGFGVFADADLWQHFGVEAELHRVSGPAFDRIAETSYLVGGRYRYPIRNLSPYLKILAGGSNFSSKSSGQNGGYGIYAGGGGVDYGLTQHLVVRADYEYQRWGSFPPHGLQPNVFLAGVAYRFR